MRFESKIDLDLELTLVGGDEREIAGPRLSARQAGALAQMMNDGGAEFDKMSSKKRTPEAVGVLFSGQLSEVYDDVAPEWWTENLSLGTIKEIRDFVLSTLLGVERKGASSGK